MMTVKRRLAETLRRIHSGRLPVTSSVKFFVRSGKGDGVGILDCDGCGDAIAQYERCYEMPRPGVASLHLHDECFTASGQARITQKPDPHATEGTAGSKGQAPWRS
jgi:hypothetical protein